MIEDDTFCCNNTDQSLITQVDAFKMAKTLPLFNI